jgi:hypothetical protein
VDTIIHQTTKEKDYALGANLLVLVLKNWVLVFM